MKKSIIVVGVLVGMLGSGGAFAAQDLDACLNEQDVPRIARVLDPQGEIVFARVTAHVDGFISHATTIAPDGTPLREVFERSRQSTGEPEFSVDNEQVCAVVALPESALDAETHVLVSTGLNYAAHAEEAGGGDVFLFPKPSAPTRPYARVHARAGVTLLDYEVELAFVLLEDVDPFAPPSSESLMAKSAFFLSNDVSDRESIISNAAFSGTGTGFSDGKGQPGFMPAGPWMILGSDLEHALKACGAKGLGLRLFVDQEEEPRQNATTEQMILQPAELVARIGTWIEEYGRRTTMTFVREGEERVRFYPLAVPEELPMLTAGSVVQTGTPAGVALNAPSPLGITLRGALRLRSPFEQFLVEEKERVAAGGTDYLEAGNVVRAMIDGLGSQLFTIGEAGGRPNPHPCDDDGDPVRARVNP